MVTAGRGPFTLPLSIIVFMNEQLASRSSCVCVCVYINLHKCDLEKKGANPNKLRHKTHTKHTTEQTHGTLRCSRVCVCVCVCVCVGVSGEEDHGSRCRSAVRHESPEESDAERYKQACYIYSRIENTQI